MLWLWLDDQPNTVDDIYRELKSNDIRVERFQNPAQLTNYLIKNRDNLDDFGLILDIMLQGQKLITIPKEWSNEDDNKYKVAHGMGHDAGLLFYEEMVLGLSDGKLYWENPPPVLFMTVIDNRTTSFDNRLYNIKEKWGGYHKLDDISKAKVSWERKWERKSKFIDILKRYSNE